jgi:hypothetical protein
MLLRGRWSFMELQFAGVFGRLLGMIVVDGVVDLDRFAEIEHLESPK